MLTLTPAAVEVVNAITSGPGVPESAGLRIASTGEDAQAGALQVELVTGPAERDQVLAETGARIFLEPQAATFLDDKVLNGELDEQGRAHFTVGGQVDGSGAHQA